jgi:hypothetical protein
MHEYIADDILLAGLTELLPEVQVCIFHVSVLCRTCSSTYVIDTEQGTGKQEQLALRENKRVILLNILTLVMRQIRHNRLQT